MRIAVSADQDKGLDSVVGPHFGRCPYFVLVDVEECQVTAVRTVENPFYAAHQPGQVPGFIHSQGASVMLTGGMGGRAIEFFQQYGVEPVTGAFGTVQMSLEAYLGGALEGAAACRESQDHGHGDAPAAGVYEKNEVERLAEEAELLQQQLDDVAARLNKLV